MSKQNRVLPSLLMVVLLATVVLIPLLPVSAAESQWKLTWSDEFNTADNSALDESKWTFEIGDGYGGWGNGELEYYTDRLKNACINKGFLVITVLKETYEEYWDYTSARLKTKGKFEQTYGRFEARIKLPYSQGLWPAFWLLGNNFEQVGWPKCGEIDIMENSGKNPNKLSGTIHGPGYSGALGLGDSYLSSAKLSDDYHIYALEWEPDAIRWYFDDKLYQTRTPNDLADKTRWVFDHPFFIILNVAVGGYFPGNPDETSVFPQQMAVDYIRVYSHK
jgi:beta-glucanase (GH16 family)